MGVKDLWHILEDVGQELPLCHIKGKRVAVDLSIWVVQSQLCDGLNSSKKPHLRNLFYRLSYLLTNDILPIFVIEGKPPDLKGKTIRKRLKKSCVNDNPEETVTRRKLDALLKECQDLLDSLGVPWIKSSGEAESMCAFLNSKGLVDGCITDDSDAFLYGAETVYKDFTITGYHPQIKEFTSKGIEEKLGLNREKLVSLALLLGCDYIPGVPGIGKAQAIKFMKDNSSMNVLERFKLWKTQERSELFPQLDDVYLDGKCPPHCRRCSHIGKQSEHNQKGCRTCDSEFTCYFPQQGEKCACYWHRIQSELKVYNKARNVPQFPSEEVIDEYFSFSAELPNKETFHWQEPKLACFQELAFNWFGWTAETSQKKSFAIFTSWQIAELCRGNSSAAFVYEPLRIVRIAKSNERQYYKILWKYKGDSDDSNFETGIDEEQFTLEEIPLFSKAYPEMETTFLIAQDQKKNKGSQRKKPDTKKSPTTRRRKAKDPVETSSASSLSKKVESVECVSLVPLSRDTGFCSSDKADDSIIANISPGVKGGAGNTSNVESDDDFLDLPLTQRLQLYSQQRNVVPTSVYQTPVASTVIGVSSKGEHSLKSCDSFDELLLRSGIRGLESRKSTEIEKYLGLANCVTPNCQTPRQLQLIYSLPKPFNSEAIRLSSGYDDCIVCTSTPSMTNQSRFTCTNLSLRFEKLLVSTPNSIDEEYDASEDLFPSAIMTSHNHSDSVICLS